MTDNIYEFPDRSIIEEEAGAWLIRLDADTPLSAEDISNLRAWLDRSPAHREELGNLITFYGKMNILTELAVPLGKPDARQKPGMLKRLRQTAFNFQYAAGAAALCVLMLAVIFTTWPSRDPSMASNGLYATVVGKQQTVTLTDSSIIQLNTNTQVKVEYDGHYRNIRLLQGEAHFTVAKNPRVPFRVYAGNGRIQAVGTAFSVYLRDNDINVTVTEGRVALASIKEQELARQKQNISPAGHIMSAGVDMRDDDYAEIPGTVKAGQSIIMRSKIVKDAVAQSTVTVDGIHDVEQQELARRLSWRNGLLTFSGEPLEKVVDEISRYTTVSIEIVDPVVRSIRIGGQFRVGDIDAMLDALETNFGLRINRLSDNHIQVAAAKTP